MKKPDIPENEDLRLRSLTSLNLLDTAPEERFNRIVRMAKRMFDVPVAFVSLIDSERQWFKASDGLGFNEIPRDHSVCAHAFLGDDVFMVTDAAADNRFADGPLVLSDTNMRFYASCPLKLPNGCSVGTLCIIDHHPRSLDADQMELLRDLAATAEREFIITQSAMTDDLTGIYNRQGFILAARHSLNLCVRQDLPATLAYLDLSNYDTDAMSPGSDRVLTDISHLLKSECRPSDIFARLYRNEFAALFINAPKEAAEGIMGRFRRRLMSPGRKAAEAFDFNFGYELVEYDFMRHKDVEILLDDGAMALVAAEEDVTAA